MANGLLLLVVSALLFFVSMAFTACTGETAALGPCVQMVSLFFGVSVVLAVLPVVAVLRFDKRARGYLWGWAVFIAIAFIPVGSIVGGHTIYLLYTRPDRERAST